MMPEKRKKLVSDYENETFERLELPYRRGLMPISHWTKFLEWVYGLKVWLREDR